MGTMVKNLLFYSTLAAISLAFGVWLRGRMSVSFTGFQGEYTCRDFGLPDKDHNVLRFNVISEDQITVDALKGSETYEVGRLRPQSESQARLELGSALIHSPNMPLNPLAEHLFEGRGRSVFLIGRQEGREIYRFECRR